MPSKRPCPTDATEISLSGWSSAAGRTGTSRSKATSSRTRLRTPDEEELAELELPSLGKHLGSGNDTSLEGVERPSTPPPSVARTALLGTPPSLLSPNRSGSPPSLLDYTKRSPLSVREDPDARKLYLILPPSSPNSSPSRNRSSRKRKDGPEVGTLSPSPSPSSLSRTDMEAGAGASLRRRIVLKGRGAGTENVGLGVGLEDKGDESEADEDGLVLQPGRDKGKRVRLGSPKAASEEQHDANTWAATAEEEDEGLVITPRIVREQPKGYIPSPHATPSKAAVFASPANGRSQLPSSTPSKDVHRLLRAYPKPAGSPQAASLPTQLAADGADHEDPFGGGSITTSQRQKTHDLFPTKLSLLPYNLSPALPLPEHYASLLTLHIALEHALVVHLATAGAGAASSEQQGDDHAVRLPNLITYSALRPLVERTGGRRLGSEELARLVWVWSDVGSSGEEKSQRDQDQDKDADVGGLGFLVNRTRTLDARTGKRTWDWGLGIELSLSRALGSATARRPQTPPVEVSFRNAATAAPSSPVPSSTSSPAGPSTPTRRSRTSSGEALLASPRRRNDGLRTGREGMSLVALWNNGIEVRKMEVARRLRERAGRLHQAWLDSPACTSATASCLSEAETPRTMHTEKYAEKDDVPRTPSRKMTRVGDAQIGADGLPTPSATRSRSGTGSRRNGRIMHFDPAELDAEMSAEEEEEEEEARMLLKGSLATPPATPVSARGQRAVAQRRAHTEVDVASSSTYAEVAWSPPAEGTVLETWHPLFDLSSLPPIPRATLPSLRDPAPSLYGNGGGLFAAQGIRGLAQSRRLPGFGSDKAGSAQTQAHAGPETPVKGVSTAAEVDQSTAGRATSLLDRIRAKETAKRAELLRASQRRSSNQAASGTGAGVPADGNVELAGIMSSFKRRSTLSRLPDVAEALYLLFTSSSTPSSLPTRRRVPVLPLADVLSSIGKSAKVALSRAEAREALELLRELAPGFVEIRKVGNGEWATLKTGEMAVGLKEVRERIRRELVAE